MNDRPNILIFMTDQQQGGLTDPDHPCKTPNAEKLAEEGITFTNFHTVAAHCCPARASFFSGVHPSIHGVFNNVSNAPALSRGVRAGIGMFSEGLRAGGYRLYYAGKWHVSDEENPRDRGWEELMVNAAAACPRMGISMTKWKEIAPRMRFAAHRGRGMIERPGYPDFTLYGDQTRAQEESHVDGGMVGKAVDALPDLARNGRPWCLYVGVVGPHDPYRVPRRYLDMYDPQRIPLPASYRDDLRDKPGIYRRQRKLWSCLSDEEVKEAIHHYWASTTRMDAYFGSVMDALEETGQAENTLVVFMSDHGDYAGAHGLFLKGVPAFEEAYHVPCIMRWPRGIRNPGRTVDALVSMMDFAPTFLEVGRAAPLPKCTGRSLAPFFTEDTPPDWRDALYMQLNGVELYYTQRIVRTKSRKYVFNGFDVDEYYDLEKDPHEMRNRIDDPACREDLHRLVRRMWHFAYETEDTIGAPYPTVALAPWGPGDAFREA